MISTLVVAAQAEEANFVEAPPPIAGPRQPSNASTFMESSSGANPVDDSAPFAKPIQVLADAQSKDSNFGGVPLPVVEPLLPPHASTVTGVSSEAHPVKDLSSDEEEEWEKLPEDTVCLACASTIETKQDGFVWASVSPDDIGAGHNKLCLPSHEERPQVPCSDPSQLRESPMDFDLSDANEAAVAADVADAVAADLLAAGISLEHISV